MSRSVTSPAVTRRKKRPATTTETPSIASSVARRPPKRKASSTSSGSTSGAGASAAAGTSATPPKRARKAAAAAATAAAPAPNPSTPPAARKRKSKAESSKKATPEKRLVRFIPSPTVATSERISRAFQHRLYLLDKKLVGDDPNSPSACHFNVLGSTCNVYDVKLQQRPSCSCPDFPRSGLCKHILFVMLRVLKLDKSDPRIWQKALLKSELNELLDISAISDGVLASQSVRQRFQELQRREGKLEGGGEASPPAPPKPVQREITGDCPICYEQMDDGNNKAKEPVVFCRVCGNNVHRDCFDRWCQSKSSSGGQFTCIYCRAVWADSESESVTKGKLSASSFYVNLADVSEAHRDPASLEDLYPESHRWIGFHGRRGIGRGRGRGRGR